MRVFTAKLMVLNYATFSMYLVKLIFLQSGEINLGLLANADEHL